VEMVVGCVVKESRSRDVQSIRVWEKLLVGHNRPKKP
jgi:hypothetical protein